MTNPVSMLPPKLRMGIYVAVGLAALVVASIDQFYGGSGPDWVDGAMRVAAFLGGALGLTAATHVPAAPDAQVRVQGHHPYGTADRLEP